MTGYEPSVKVPQGPSGTVCPQTWCEVRLHQLVSFTHFKLAFMFQDGTDVFKNATQTILGHIQPMGPTMFLGTISHTCAAQYRTELQCKLTEYPFSLVQCSAV